MIKENQRYLNQVFVVLDAFSIIFSLSLSWYIRFKTGIIPSAEGYLSYRQYVLPLFCVIPVYLFLYNALKLYDPYRMKGRFEEFLNLFKANVWGLLIFVLVLFLFKEINYSRYLLFVFACLSLFITFSERMIVRIALRYLRKSGHNIKHIVIVGYSELTIELLKRFESHKHWGYNVVGILDDNINKKNIREISNINKVNKLSQDAYSKKEFAKSATIVGKLSELEEYLTNNDIDEVFITLGIKEYDKLASIIGVCEKSGVRTEVIPDYYKYIPAKPYVEEVDGLPVINLRYVPLDNLINKAVKRFFDIVISIICILIFSPIMLGAAAVIKLTSPGPIIFRQERIGHNKKPFTMYKFRSMKLQKDDEEKIKWTTANDPRKTKFGNFLRKTSIDELPQLFNVLKGDMSIVGPRPERSFFVDQFKEKIPKYMVKHQVRPGITGWAQVNGWRGDTSIEKRIEFDIYYIENWDFLLDIKILWLTVFKGFINKNAY